MTIAISILCIAAICLAVCMPCIKRSIRNLHDFILLKRNVLSFDFARYLDHQAVLLVRKGHAWHVFSRQDGKWHHANGTLCSRQLASRLDDLVYDLFFTLD